MNLPHHMRTLADRGPEGNLIIDAPCIDSIGKLNCCNPHFCASDYGRILLRISVTRYIAINQPRLTRVSLIWERAQPQGQSSP